MGDTEYPFHTRFRGCREGSRRESTILEIEPWVGVEGAEGGSTTFNIKPRRSVVGVEGQKGVPHPRNRAETLDGQRQSATPQIEPRRSISQVVGMEGGRREFPSPDAQFRGWWGWRDSPTREIKRLDSISRVVVVVAVKGRPSPSESGRNAQYHGW